MTSLARRRALLVLGAAAVVMTGLTVHEVAGGWAGAFAGDALYAVLAYALVGVVAPRLRPGAVGAIALAACVGVALLQLTGVPARLSATIPGVELVLGSTFQATDLIAYAIGAAAGTAGDLLIRRRAAGSCRDGRTTPCAGAPEQRPRAGTPSR